MSNLHQDTELRQDLVRLATSNPELRKHLVPLLKQATEFDSPEALKKYLHEHPDADRSKHTVKKQDGGGSSGGKPQARQDFESQLSPDVRERLKGLSKGDFKSLIQDALDIGSSKPTERKQFEKSLAPDIRDKVHGMPDKDYRALLQKALAMGGGKSAALRQKAIKLAHAQPELRSYLVPLLKVAAPLYNHDGKTLTQSEMLQQAVAKEVIFMGNKRVLKYHVIMAEDGDTATVFDISKALFDKLRVPDRTSPRVKEEVAQLEFDNLIKTKLRNMRDQVEFNLWRQKEKPTIEEQTQWLQSKR